MLLATGPAFDFVKFVQILCWIILPVFLLAGLLTVFLHYRKKKREKAETPGDNDESFMHASPELLGYTKGDGEYVFFDHSSLISGYKKRLSFNHARYTALHYDFEKLETKYAMLARYTAAITNKKNTNMENLRESMPRHVEKEINKMVIDYEAEKKELIGKLEQLNKSYQSLELEHESLLEKVSMETVTDEEKAAIINRWREENIALKEKVAEQDYVKEILEEKKIQIGFLQNQLEQRIKGNHQSENERNQLLANLEQSKSSNENVLKQLESLKNELPKAKEENSKLQMVLNEKEGLLSERQQLLASKLDHITWLENTLHESKEQNELLNASVADTKDLVSVLQDQLLYEQARTQAIEQKLASQKQLMQRLYKDFSAAMNEENEQSPVIPMRPDYINLDIEEIAAQ